MWKKIIEGLKIFGIITGTITVLFGGFRFIENSKQSVIQSKNLSDTVNYHFNRVYTRLDRIENSVIDIGLQVSDHQYQQKTLQKSYIDYVRKNTQNTEDLYNFLKDFIDTEKKTNDKPIVYYVRPIDTTQLNSALKLIK